MTMKAVSDEELAQRMRIENPWWSPPHSIDQLKLEMPRRAYFDLFFPYVEEFDPRRALILMGPRRVGKTVMLHQAIQKRLDEDASPSSLIYLDLQSPIYNNVGLAQLLRLAKETSGYDGNGPLMVFFDEIQYLPTWEVHLKNLVDSYPEIKFIASGSAAAALRLKSAESGAGRFTDFLLPPVTYYEYLLFRADDRLFEITEGEYGRRSIGWNDLGTANDRLIEYLNIGGYPEAIFSKTIQADPGRYIRGDIVDKVLMKDLPSLYGIHDIQELNSLFTMLAYNTGNEVSLDSLSQNSGVSKNTIKKYIVYLESAFLIKVVHRIDRGAKRFARANFFKVYLTNPCIRSALFAPLSEGDEGIGHLVETGVFSQWFHSTSSELYYGRWGSGVGEVDMIRLGPDLRPSWALEVKWSDSCIERPAELRSLSSFINKNSECTAIVTTKTREAKIPIAGTTCQAVPTAAYCYYVGWNIIRMKHDEIDSISVFSP